MPARQEPAPARPCPAVTGIARYDALIAGRTAGPAWRGTGSDRRYEADTDLLGDILTIPVSEGATPQSRTDPSASRRVTRGVRVRR